MNTIPPAEPVAEAADVELHYHRDSALGLTGFLIVIPDSRLEGMPGPSLKTIIPQLWVSSRTKGHRVHLLANAVQAIEAYQPLGGTPAPVRKPRWSERIARFVAAVFGRGRK